MPAVRPDCLLVEGCDFVAFPPGGQLTTARQMMAAFGERLALVGICTDDTPTGRWIERDLGGKRFLFYGVGRRKPSAKRPLIPARLSQFLRLSRHREGILSLGVRAALLQAPEELMVVSKWGLESLCYRFPGVANPLVMARYAWGRLLARWFDRRLFDALERTDVIFASADEEAIGALVRRSAGRLARERIHRLPTHYDSTVFVPAPSADARRSLGLGSAAPLLVSSGRLNHVKGWDLVIDAFAHVRATRANAHLVFVGDGEDRHGLERRAAAAGVADAVTVTGFVAPRVVATWLNAADVVVVGSYVEGWSIAMLEALGCGKPLVSTDVSGAREMIRQGENGFVVRSRDPRAFARAILSAADLSSAPSISLSLARNYDLANLIRQVGSVWKVLA
jgi:glycosyltransferase involved in cell wall biosynthesis